MPSREELKKIRQFIGQLPEGETVYDRVLTWFEIQSLTGITKIIEEANRREEEEWHDPEAIRERFDGYAAEQEIEQFTTAVEELRQRFADVGIAYHTVTAQGASPEVLQDPIREAYLALENPMIQESLLIGVREEFEPLVQEGMADMRALMLGWAHVSTGIDSPFADQYLERCPADLQQTYEEQVRQQQQAD